MAWSPRRSFPPCHAFNYYAVHLFWTSQSYPTFRRLAPMESIGRAKFTDYPGYSSRLLFLSIRLILRTRLRQHISSAAIFSISFMTRVHNATLRTHVSKSPFLVLTHNSVHVNSQAYSLNAAFAGPMRFLISPLSLRSAAVIILLAHGNRSTRSSLWTV